MTVRFKIRQIPFFICTDSREISWRPRRPTVPLSCWPSSPSTLLSLLSFSSSLGSHRGNGAFTQPNHTFFEQSGQYLYEHTISQSDPGTTPKEFLPRQNRQAWRISNSLLWLFAQGSQLRSFRRSILVPWHHVKPGVETLPGGEKATQAQSFGTLCSISAGGAQITGSYQYQHQCSWISIKHLINNKINNMISRASVKVLRIWIVRACQYWFNSHMAKSWILIHCNSAKGGVSSPERCIRTGRDGYNTLSILTFLYQQQFHHSIITTCITIDQHTIDLEIKQEMEKGRDSWMYWGKHSILIFLCPPHLKMSIYVNRKCYTSHWLMTN